MFLSVRSFTSEPHFGGFSRCLKEGNWVVRKITILRPIHKCNKVTTNSPQSISIELSPTKKKHTPKCEMHCRSCLHLEAITAVHFQAGGAVDVHTCPLYAWLIAPDFLNTEWKVSCSDHILSWKQLAWTEKSNHD